MSSAHAFTVCVHASNCAAHDALQTRDLTEARHRTEPGLWRSRISGAPLRSDTRVDDASAVYALALHRIRDTRPPSVGAYNPSPRDYWIVRIDADDDEPG
jgi:hypothetical protein